MTDFCLCGRLRDGCAYHDPKLQPGYAVPGCVYDVSGVAFIQGVTNFTCENLIDALSSFGIHVSIAGMGGLTLVVHPALFSRLNKCGLIDNFPGNPSVEGLRITSDSNISLEHGVTFALFQLEGKTAGMMKVREH